MMETFKEWWPFGAFVLTGVFGWMIGVERNRWKISDLTESVNRLELRVETLEKQGSDEKASLATINANITAIMRTLERLESRIDDKRDK